MRARFEAAFLDAGAARAQSFLTNRTMAFEASGLRAARKVLAAASRALAASGGVRELGFLRERPHLEALVDAAPFEFVDAVSVYGCYVTLLHRNAVLPADLPPASPSGDVRLIWLTATKVFCVACLRGKSPSSPNALLEKARSAP